MTKQRSNYIRKYIGIHPGENLRLMQILGEIKDPRGESPNFDHSLTTVLFITVVCSLCGSNDWEVIVVQANAMKDWLNKFVDLSNGVPCVRTFKRVFSLLCPAEDDY